MSDEMKEQIPETVYSHDEEEWTEDYDEVRCRAIALLDHDDIGFTYYEGEKKNFGHSAFVNGDRIIEDIREAALDEVGEYAEDYLFPFQQEHINSLEKLVVEFLYDTIGAPTFWQVVNVETKTEPLTSEELAQLHTDHFD